MRAFVLWRHIDPAQDITISRLMSCSNYFATFERVWFHVYSTRSQVRYPLQHADGKADEEEERRLPRLFTRCRAISLFRESPPFRHMITLQSPV